MLDWLTGGVGSVISGGLSYLGGMEQRAMQQDMFRQQMDYNAGAEARTRVSNAHEAALARQFSSDEAEKARWFNAEEANKARGFNAEQSQLARDFEERLSSSAYQRATMDMRKAGLNPILALMKGGASTPGGAAASGPAASGPSASGTSASSSPSSAPSAPHVSNIMASALEASKVIPAIDNMITEKDRIKSSTALNWSQNALQAEQAEQVKEQTKKVKQETETEKERTAQVAGEAHRARQDIELYKWAPWLRNIGTASRELDPAITNAGKIISPFMRRFGRW